MQGNYIVVALAFSTRWYAVTFNSVCPLFVLVAGKAWRLCWSKNAYFIFILNKRITLPPSIFSLSSSDTFFKLFTVATGVASPIS